MKNQEVAVWSQGSGPAVPAGLITADGQRFTPGPAWPECLGRLVQRIWGPRPESGAMLSLVTDSQPDSWGRRLLGRVELLSAARADRQPRILSDAGMLFGVSDFMRAGALRFSRGPLPDAACGENPRPVPGAGDLEKLAVLARRFEEGELIPCADLSYLAAAGAVLGGSRPKAGFIGEDGSLWLAKFPSVHDDRDMGAWGWVALELARRAGIRIPDFALAETGSGGRALLTRRFDRTPSGGRRHFFSTRAFVGGCAASAGRSYLSILAIAEKLGGRSGIEAEELWRRVAFRILTGDGDDHLRNSGFLMGGSGWELAPAYDLNPSPSVGDLSMAWDEHCTEMSPSGFLAAAPYWGINSCRAREIMDEVRAAVTGWRDAADMAGIGRAAIEAMAPAFRNAEAPLSRGGRRSGDRCGGWSFRPGSFSEDSRSGAL